MVYLSGISAAEHYFREKHKGSTEIKL